MNNALTSTLLAAAVLGGGVVGAGALAGVAGASDSPTRTEITEITATDVLDADGVVTVQDADTDEAPTDGEGDRDGCERRGHRGARNLDNVAEVLGVDEADLRAQLESGATIADIAGDDIDAVIDALVAEKSERIAQAVEDGRLSQAEADERLAELEDRITDKVNGVRPDRDAVDADGEIAS